MQKLPGLKGLPQLKVNKWFILLLVIVLMPVLSLVIVASVFVLPFYFLFQYLEKRKRLQLLILKNKMFKDGRLSVKGYRQSSNRCR
jgi:uncharacterized membrane protein